MSPRLRFGLMLAGFAVLTALGVWWAAPGGATLERTLRELAGLGAGNTLVLGACALGMLCVETVRLIVFGRVLGMRIGARAGFDAAIANHLFSTISPGAVLGEPAIVYVLGRRGVPWDAALAISFGKYATGFALFMGTAGVLLAAGFGPELAHWAVVPIALTIAVGVVLVGSFVVGALRPDSSLRAIDAAERWLLRRRWLRGGLAARAVAWCAGTVRRSIERLAQFRRAGIAGWLALLGGHVLYYGSYVALIVVLAGMFGARSPLSLVPLAIIYQAFTYAAAVPGLPEAVAVAFFGGVLPAGEAFAVVLLFRALTAYLQVVLALVYLPVNGLLRSILERRDAEGV